MRVVRSEAPAKTELLPTPADIDHASSLVRASDLVVCAPMLRAPALDRGAPVWLALENLQRSGSFKIRGALVALSRIRDRGGDAVVAASAGNHGAGVAAVARRLGVAATIVVPETAPRKKVDGIRGAGATVIEHGAGYDDAEAFAMKLATDRGHPFLSPYDDIDVAAGNGGSLATEIAESLGEAPGLVVAPFGGGGLASGLACGFTHAVSLDRRVWGVESEASPSFSMSIERRAAVTTLPPAETWADGLEGGITERAFERAAGVVAGVLVVTEDAIERAMMFAFRELGLVLEGSAAAALAPLLEGLPAELLDRAGPVVVVLTGRNVDRERLSRLPW